MFVTAMIIGYTAWTVLAIIVGGFIVEFFLDRLRWRRWEKEQEKKMLANMARVKAEQEDKQ